MTKNMANCNFDALEILTKASSKDVVVKTCNEAFIFRNRKTYPNEVIAAVSQNFSCDVKESKQLLQNLGLIIKTAVFQGSTDPNVLVQIFPGKFHKNLRDLLIKTMMSNLDNWKNQAINGQVSLPRLLEFDWRVDIKTSSDSVARMSVPTCILQLLVQENKTKVEETPDISFVNVELSKETLDTMLDGLSKIRDQLSSVAKR